MNKRRGRQPGNPEVETPTGNPEVETPIGNPKVETPTENPKVATPRRQPRGGNPEVVTPSGNPEKTFDTEDLMRFCLPHTQLTPEEPRPGARGKRDAADDFREKRKAHFGQDCALTVSVCACRLGVTPRCDCAGRRHGLKAGFPFCLN